MAYVTQSGSCYHDWKIHLGQSTLLSRSSLVILGAEYMGCRIPRDSPIVPSAAVPSGFASHVKEENGTLPPCFPHNYSGLIGMRKEI